MTMLDTSRERPMHVAPPLAPSFAAECDMPDPSLPDIRRLEALAARAWPSRDTRFDGTWAVRLCDHDTKRQNSVVPLDPNDRRDLRARIETARERFAQAGRRPTFRLTPLAHPAIDLALADAGWERVDTTHVMVADLSAIDGAERVAVETCPQRWVALHAELDGIAGRRAPGLERTLQRIRESAGPVTEGHGPAHLHVAHGRRGPAATALVVQLDREAGLMEVHTDPERRGRGHGRRVVTGALAAARERGATRAWLQVESSNAVAIGLYGSLGFHTVYDYHYRVAPTS